MRVVGDLALDPREPDNKVEEEDDRDGRQEGRQLDGPAGSEEGTTGSAQICRGGSFDATPIHTKLHHRALHRRYCPRPSRCVWDGWTIKLLSPLPPRLLSCPPNPLVRLESREETHAPMPAPWKPSSRRLGTPSWLAASAPRTMYLRWKHALRRRGGG